jgi:hypothetical protein
VRLGLNVCAHFFFLWAKTKMKGLKLMQLISCAIFATLVFATPALGAEIANLPEGAKLLTKAEIVAVYDGKPFVWTHPFTDKGNGTFNFVASKSYMSGKFDFGGKKKGDWEGKVTWKGEVYCIQTRAKGGKKYDPMQCQDVYQVGDKFYEVNVKSKKVTSVNMPQ